MALADFGEGFLEQAGKVFLTSLDIKEMQRRNKMEETKLLADIKAGERAGLLNKWNTVMNIAKTQSGLKTEELARRTGEAGLKQFEKTGYYPGTKSMVTSITPGAPDIKGLTKHQGYSLIAGHTAKEDQIIADLNDTFGLDKSLTQKYINELTVNPGEMDVIAARYQSDLLKLQAERGKDESWFTSVSGAFGQIMVHEKEKMAIREDAGISQAKEPYHIEVVSPDAERKILDDVNKALKLRGMKPKDME